MPSKNKIKGGVISFIGYLLSPISWWNDLFINLPIAYIIAWPFSLISETLFLPILIIAYWLTNIIGLIMMRTGIIHVFSKTEKTPLYTKKGLIIDISVSIIYTLIIVILIKTGIIAPIHTYF
jgi:hypothetical protein